MLVNIYYYGKNLFFSRQVHHHHQCINSVDHIKYNYPDHGSGKISLLLLIQHKV
eukprot:gene1492-879_t